MKKTSRESILMTCLLIIFFLISTAIKILYVSGNNFAFTPDQGRDLIDLRHMFVTHTPRLVGPTTSINGVLLGPFYYYFISIPFALFHGSPASIVIWQIIWYQLSAIFIWYILKRKNLLLGSVAAFLLLLAPIGFYTGRYFWNANAMPIFTIFFFACLLAVLRQRDFKNLIALGFVAGISLQVEAAFGILFLPFALLVGVFKKFSFKDHLYTTLAFLVTLIPQIIFEIRHQFIMTKILIAGLTGKSGDLGEKLTLSHRFQDRLEMFMTSLRHSNHISFQLLWPIIAFFGIIFVYFLASKKLRKLPGTELTVISISFLFFSALFYLIFPQEVKHWYVYGLVIPVVLFLSGSLVNIKYSHRLAGYFVWAFVAFTAYHTILAHSVYLYQAIPNKSDDPSNFAVELRAVDTVYQAAKGRPFRVYNYLPSVYDFTYQYLFWWYGTKKYGYQPSEISYLPNQPEYIKDNDRMWTKKKSAAVDSPTYLIIQGDNDHQQRLFAWEGSFSHLCLSKTIEVVKSVTIKELYPCNKISSKK